MNRAWRKISEVFGHQTGVRSPFRRRRCAAAGVAAALLAGAALAAYILPPLDTAPYFTVSRSGELRDREGRLLHAFLNDNEQWCFPRAFEAFSPRLMQATIAVEDQRFFQHPGVDPIAGVRAFVQNFRHRRIVSGASTLTMQTVKFTHRDSRSVSGKLAQVFEALRLDLHAGKRDILCAYLNRAPYGLNIVGAEAASRRYFGKPSSELTLSEAALLAGIPKSPRAFQPLEHPARARARRNHVLQRMRDEGFISSAEYAEAKAQPLGVSWHAYPHAAPHFAMRFRERIRREGVAAATLDESVQRRVERLARGHLKRFDGEVTNAAVMVIDVGSADVLAYVGSADFFNRRRGGQVDLCRAPRSPGSTLKPFTYALAIERNRLYVSEQLLDDTLDYGTYNPANFDGLYNGLIPAAEALRYSLNVPAVTVLERLGPAELYRFLRRVGISTLRRSPDYYGLGLTLGNCEVRLDELGAAYRMLADLGGYRPLRLFADDPPPRAQKMLSRGTALAMYAMLEQPFPEELDRDLVRARGICPRVCWKTGTSTGYHDAWSVAYNQQYVVAVWVGNNNGKPSRRLIGSEAALPLAAAVFRSLPLKVGPVWPEVGTALRPVEVCAVSGLPASPWCAAKRTELFPQEQFLNRTCDVHRPLAGAECAAERWPGDAHQWDLAEVRQPVDIRLETPGARKIALRITAPVEEAEYVLTGESGADRIRLSASVDAEVALHWYLDDRYLGTSMPVSPVFLELTEGQHRLACMTPEGAWDRVQFIVLKPDGERRLRGS